MLTKLTQKQKDRLDEINKEAVDKFYNWGRVDEEQIRQSVYKLYSYAKLKNPIVEFLDFSEPNLGSKGISAVGSAVDSAVGSAVRSAVGSAVDSAVFYTYRWWREDWWIAYRKFFSEILPNFPLELFEDYRKVYDAGFFYYFMFENYCWVVKMPEKIDKWVGEGYDRRLHSDTSEAIDISGLKLYFLNGVQFPHDLWKKVVSKEMPFEEIIKIEDIDQRTQAMKYGDPQKFFELTKAVKLDEYLKFTPEGKPIVYQLYQIPKGEIFTEDAYYLYYQCPSTGKTYISGVEKCSTVSQGMSWKFQVSEEDWRNLKPLITES